MENKLSYYFLAKILIRSLKKFSWQISVIVLGTVVNITSLLIMPQLLSNVLYHTVSGSISINDLLLLAAMMVVVQVISFISSIQRKNVKIELNCQMKVELLEKVFSVRTREDLPDSGKVISILFSDANVVSDILLGIDQLAVSIIQALVCLHLMIVLNSSMTVVFLAINGLFFAINNFFRLKIFSLNKQSVIASDNILNLTKNIVNDLPELIISNTGCRLKKFYENMVFSAKKIILKCENMMLQATYLTAFSQSAILLVLLIWANLLMKGNEFYGESFVRYMVYVQYASASFQKIITLPSSIASLKVRIDRIAELFALSDKWKRINGSKQPFIDKIIGINIKNLHCTIGNRTILKNLSLNMDSKEIVTITGANGSGKTTLLRCICRQILLSDGAININNVDLNDIEITSFLEKISIMASNIFFEHMTIMENLLLFSSENPDLKEIIFVCKELNIYNDINMLPDGFNTVVDEQHIQLSKGQIQRICIARCLLKKADLYIFDEPTSHTDSLFSKRFFSLIERMLNQKCVIILTHDKGILDMAKKYYEILNGEIVMREKI